MPSDDFMERADDEREMTTIADDIDETGFVHRLEKKSAAFRPKSRRVALC